MRGAGLRTHPTQDQDVRVPSYGPEPTSLSALLNSLGATATSRIFGLGSLNLRLCSGLTNGLTPGYKYLRWLSMRTIQRSPIPRHALSRVAFVFVLAFAFDGLAAVAAQAACPSSNSSYPPAFTKTGFLTNGGNV